MTARILVAEDSAVVRAVVREQLEVAGYQVLEAEDGPSALEQATIHRPDMLLLDIEMPGLDGHEVLRAMRDDEQLSAVPVVFLTGRSRVADVVESFQLGAHDFLTKPFEPAELLARVSAALRIKALQDALRARAGELEVLNRTDTLTGLWNRRHLDEQLQVVASASRRQQSPMGVLMLDVDHFKRINDARGHAGGDEVLRQLARRLRATARIEDVVGRWGGEEFLVVCPATDLEGAWRLAERIRVAVSDRPIPLAGGDEVVVTISVGAAAADGVDPERLVRLADEALYDAKQDGRNKVRTALL